MKYLITLMLLLPFVTAAETEVWLIGGGSNINNSQGQIEQNVLWLRDLLSRKISILKLHTYFGIGNSKGKDVVYWKPIDDDDPAQVIARIFVPVDQIGKNYKRHDFKQLDGGTQKDQLIAKLSKDFEQIRKSNDVLLVYNGHGGYRYSNTKYNFLKLWGDTSLTVAELDNLLDKIPQANTTRFILTQCFSGAFYHLIFDDPENEVPAKQNRCGFMAESAHREAEGCSLGINKSEYRDYTTYFFAALDGQTRLDTELDSNPDLNEDQQVSYREAHLYALQTAQSQDLSRSTSEVYLENWQPWYLRWQTTTDNPKSIYWKIAKNVANRHQLTLDTNNLREKRNSLERDNIAVKAELQTLYEDIEARQEKIQQSIKLRWPELFEPYTDTYSKILKANFKEITSEILAHQEYKLLVVQQNNTIIKQAEDLEIERNITQIDKIFRLKKLARLEHQFSRYANMSDQKQYRRLLDCEEGAID